jgi:hypothetical protein
MEQLFEHAQRFLPDFDPGQLVLFCGKDDAAAKHGMAAKTAPQPVGVTIPSSARPRVSVSICVTAMALIAFPSFPPADKFLTVNEQFFDR